jgi:hypothetical protein
MKSPGSHRSPVIFHRVAPRSELRSRPNEKSRTFVRDFLFVPRTGLPAVIHYVLRGGFK